MNITFFCVKQFFPVMQRISLKTKEFQFKKKNFVVFIRFFVAYTCVCNISAFVTHHSAQMFQFEVFSN